MSYLKAFKNTNMKKIDFRALYVLVVLLSFGCTRTEEDLPEALFPATSDVFIDNFIGLGSDFYFPYLGAKPDVFSVDRSEGFESEASIRIDVPNADDPGGGFAGAIFRIDGIGRNLSDYNALTFYARASQAATIGEVGFGQDFEGDIHRAFLSNLDFTTNWKKFIIPIPDPEKLLQEKGVFQFAAGGIGAEGQEVGYTFWLDEIKFENLPEVAQPLPQISGGNNATESAFNGITIPITGLNVIYNVDGTDVSVNAAPAYFNFSTSDESVASVGENGVITLNSTGSATITASIGEGANEMSALGSVAVTSTGEFDFAPTPPARDADDVVAIFSDVYNKVNVANYNGFFQFATTQGGAIDILGDDIISYTDLNFVSINIFDAATVDVTDMTHMHLDVYVRETVDPSDFIRLELINNDGGGSTQSAASVQLQTYSPLLEGRWVSYDIPMTDFASIGTPDDIDLIFFVSDGTISSIYIDNVYFYR